MDAYEQESGKSRGRSSAQSRHRAPPRKSRADGLGTVAQLMTSDPVTATVHESAGAAWLRMQEHEASSVIVIDGARHVVGLLSRDDLGGPAGGVHRRMGRTVRDLMHRDVATVTPRTSVARAASLMRRRETACLPVVDGGKLVGTLSVGQLLALLEQP
jgi:CBS domain-containing protein